MGSQARFYRRSHRRCPCSECHHSGLIMRTVARSPFCRLKVPSQGRHKVAWPLQSEGASTSLSLMGTRAVLRPTQAVGGQWCMSRWMPSSMWPRESWSTFGRTRRVSSCSPVGLLTSSREIRTGMPPVVTCSAAARGLGSTGPCRRARPCRHSLRRHQGFRIHGILPGGCTTAR